MKDIVSVEDRQRVYEVCKIYLRGKWALTNQTDIKVDLIEDGNVNKLFICYFPEEVKTEYKSVVIRFSNREFEDFKSNTHVLAINVVLSENNISPKVLGVFSDGIICQYIKSRYFNNKDDVNPKSVAKLAQILAKFHSMDIPIPKEASEMFLAQTDQPFYVQMRKSYLEGTAREVMIKENHSTLLKNNMFDEIEWLLKVIKHINPPIVLSHNDFNKKNILVKETESSEDFEIFLIDFDWSTYNYRGIDLGQYFSNWGHIEPEFGTGEFPTDEQMIPFIDAYIEEMCQILGDSYAKQEINSRQQLIKEGKVFALMAYIKDVMYSIWKTEMDSSILTMAELRYQCFHTLKKKILKEYSFNIDVNNN